MDRIEHAVQHTLDESGFQHVEVSLQAEPTILQQAHDSIHEFMLLAPLCFPSSPPPGVSWQNRSAFLIYHQQVFDHAHRSLFEALCTYYNVAFILLRATLELLLKGAFWECLSHSEFRDNSPILDASREGSAIKDWLRRVFEAEPRIEEDLGQNSAGIFDKLGPKIEGPAFRPSFRTVVRQLDQWGMFAPIPDPERMIYQELYSNLSADVHTIPDRTDIGRRITSEAPDIFKQHLDPTTLREYGATLRDIMDVGIVIEINVLQSLIKRFESVRPGLSARRLEIERLGLRHSLLKLNQLIP